MVSMHGIQPVLSSAMEDQADVVADMEYAGVIEDKAEIIRNLKPFFDPMEEYRAKQLENSRDSASSADLNATGGKSSQVGRRQGSLFHQRLTAERSVPAITLHD